MKISSIRKIMAMILTAALILSAMPTSVMALTLNYGLLVAPSDVTAQYNVFTEFNKVGAKIVWKDNSVKETKDWLPQPEDRYWYELERKIGENGSWVRVTRNSLIENLTAIPNHDYSYYENGDMWDEDYSNLAVYYRLRMVCYDSDMNVVAASKYSNIASVVRYKVNNVSSWAYSEVEQGKQFGFVTPKVAVDMGKAITREEFAEISVHLYETMMGTSISAGGNPFSDTKNPEVVKAYTVGIVSGTGGSSFSPKSPITREQMATMLTRVITICRPGVSVDTSGVETFRDASSISSYALNSVKFMYKSGIMKGIGNGAVGPKLTTTREQAVLMVYRTYCKY